MFVSFSQNSSSGSWPAGSGPAVRCHLPSSSSSAIALTQWMSSLLFGVERLDPATYAAVLGVLAMAAAMASYVPARRAAAIDPVETLTAE